MRSGASGHAEVDEQSRGAMAHDGLRTSADDDHSRQPPDLALAYLSPRKKYSGSEGIARPAMEVDEKKQPDDGPRFRAESLLGASLAGEKNTGKPNSCNSKAIRECRRKKPRVPTDQYHP
jgi:hypothetical protein